MRMAAGLMLGLVCSSTLFAQEGAPVETEPAAVKLEERAVTLRSDPGEDEGNDLNEAALPFGTEDTQWWTFGLGVAYNFNDATDFDVRAAYSYFLIDDVELSFEINAWYFHQPGDDAVGLNPGFLFRWHFYNGDRHEDAAGNPWTIFADLGIGLLVASDRVPEGGTAFDFMPRVGIGVTRRISDDGTRLQAGLRWHHVSNARIVGDSKNPSRDAPMVYAGVMVPF